MRWQGLQGPTAQGVKKGRCGCPVVAPGNAIHTSPPPAIRCEGGGEGCEVRASLDVEPNSDDYGLVNDLAEPSWDSSFMLQGLFRKYNSVG